MRYFLGLDNGGTTTKAALYDAQGREIAIARVDTEMIVPAAGFIERDMEKMWQANCRVICEVLEKAGLPGDAVAGVAICGHGKGLYLWGKDGRPVRNGIISTDNRAYAYPLRWKEDGTEEKAYAHTYQHIMACQPVALLNWLRDNEPECIANIQWVFECKDYVRFRLTGEARGELTDYSGASLVDLRTREYDDELLSILGLSWVRSALPPLVGSTQVAGYVTEEAAALCGLKPGTPVAGGMFDIDACALAVNVLNEQNICMIAGTWSINEYPRKSPVTDGRVQMNSLFCIPGYYLIEESSPTSAGNNEWFVKNLLSELGTQAAREGGNIYDTINSWVEAIPAETFVPIFLPFLMASNVHPNAKGAFIGMSAKHGREHLARSVYEGIVFSHKYHLEKLLATRNEPPRCIRLAGGAAKSAVWTQMFADVLGFPVETVCTDETGTLGCAITAAAAVGEYADISEAAARMCPIGVRVEPDPKAAAAYIERYALYKKAIRCLDGLWDDMQKAIEG